jgi:uncharacterized protein (TIGR02001 family)
MTHFYAAAQLPRAAVPALVRATFLRRSAATERHPLTCAVRGSNEEDKAMKAIYGTLALGATLAAASYSSASAADMMAGIPGLSANAALTSDYIFRGISQSAKRPAVSGGLDYSLGDSGFAIGTWVSSINFGDGSDLEWDLYGNYNFMLGPVGASVGVYGYIYPYAGHGGPYSFVELDGSLSYDFGVAAWSAKANWAPTLPSGFLTQRYGYNPDSEYWLSTGLSVPVAPWLSLSGNLGYEGFVGGENGAPNDSYVEYDIGATLSYDHYALDLRYINTSKHEFASSSPFFATGPFYVATFSFKFP